MRLKLIINHPLYQECMDKIKKDEMDRIFCKHDFQHCQEVAKICEDILKRSNNLVNLDIIYAAAYLHDIGRSKMNETGMSHELESAKISDVILRETGFNEAEIDEIKNAILMHRSKTSILNGITILGKALQQADKLSRHCYCCMAYQDCNWPEEKKNKQGYIFHYEN